MCSDGTLLTPSIMLTFCSVLKGDNWTECKYQETHLALLLWICMVSNAWMDVVFHISLKLLNRLTPKKKTCFDEFGYCSCRNWSEKKNIQLWERLSWNGGNIILLFSNNVITHAITLSSDISLLVGNSKIILFPLQLSFSPSGDRLVFLSSGNDFSLRNKIMTV